MAEASVVPAKLRQETGSKAARRLRASGEIPAIIYGHKEDPVALTVEADVLEALLRHGAHGLLELQVDGAKQSAVIKEMQWDALGREVLHVDFARVAKGDRVTVEVPLTLKGTAPGAAEGVLDHQMHTIELECPASNIQEEVVVNIGSLQLDESILVKDLELPEGIKATADPDQVVVQVSPAAVEEAEEEVIGGPAEPEVIRRESDEDEAAE